MKIRNGFVSNSSSSSFVLYGIELDFYDVKKLLIENLDKYNSHTGNNYTKDEFFELLEDDMYDVIDSSSFLFDGLSTEICWDCECVYVGKSPFSMKDEQTYSEFKDSVKNKLIELDMDVSNICGRVETIYG